MQISKLKCILHAFTFNDGSRVVWHPIGATDKAHDLFRVSIQFKTEDGGEAISQDRNGPASAAYSLHLLKNALKDRAGK